MFLALLLFAAAVTVDWCIISGLIWWPHVPVLDLGSRSVMQNVYNIASVVSQFLSIGSSLVWCVHKVKNNLFDIIKDSAEVEEEVGGNVWWGGVVAVGPIVIGPSWLLEGVVAFLHNVVWSTKEAPQFVESVQPVSWSSQSSQVKTAINPFSDNSISAWINSSGIASLASIHEPNCEVPQSIEWPERVVAVCDVIKWLLGPSFEGVGTLGNRGGENWRGFVENYGLHIVNDSEDSAYLIPYVSLIEGFSCI